MRLVLFEPSGGGVPAPGLLREGAVVSLDSVVPAARTPQDRVRALIDGFAELQPSIEAAGGDVLPLASVRLRAPLPRPGKVLCSTSVCRAARAQEPQPLLMTLRSAESV